MKKNLTLLGLFLVILPTLLMGQWVSTDMGSGSTGQKIYVFDDAKALATFGNSLIYKTVNSGQTWTDVSPESVPLKNLMSIDFGDLNTGLVVPQDSFLLRTTDQGDSWTRINMPQVVTDLIGTPDDPTTGNTQKFFGLGFSNATTCFTTINYKIGTTTYRSFVLKSADAGLTWSVVSADFAAGATKTITAVEFASDELTGYIVGSNSLILKTVDGGASWTKMSTAGTLLDTKYINDIHVVNKDSVYLATLAGVWVTRDGFLTMSQLTTDGANDFLICQDTVFLAAGGANKTYRSLDRGASWQVAANGAGTLFEATLFNNKIYALASSGIAYVTTPEQLLDPKVDFTVEQLGNVLNFVNLSENIGTYTWTIGAKQIAGDLTTYNIPIYGEYDISLKGINTLGEVNSEITTVVVDTIATPWALHTIGDQTVQKLVVVKKDTAAVIVGNNTAIFYTNNGGENWLPAALPSADYIGHIATDLSFFDAQNGLANFSYAAGKTIEEGFMLKTADAGASWTLVPISAFSNASGSDVTDVSLGKKIYFYPVTAINSTTAFTAIRWEEALTTTKHGYVYKTVDSGASWTIISDDIYAPTFSSTLNTLAFSADGMTGYLAGVKLLWRTVDGGASWTKLAVDALGSINDLIMIDNLNLIAATQYGTAKTTDGFSTWTVNPTDYSFDVVSLAEGVFLTGKDQQTLKVSVDGGNTWELNAAGLGSFFELAVFNREVLASGAGGKVYHAYIDNFLPLNADWTSSIDDKKLTVENLSNADSQIWSFGDGSTSTEFEPEHTYTSYGQYEVSLAASNFCKTVVNTQLLNIDDLIDPVIEGCPENISLDLTSGTTVAASWTAPTATDNSGVVTLTTTNEPGELFAPGKNTVVYTATDEAGNDVTCSFDVTVVDLRDLTNPVISACPANITLYSGDGASVAVTWTAPTATDNSGIVTLISTNESGELFSPGTVTVIYTATDEAGNFVTCSFDVTVLDATAVGHGKLSLIGVYPNPSDGSTVKVNPSNMAKGKMTFEAISLDGKVVLSRQIDYSGTGIPVELNLSKGIYQVKLTDLNGKTGLTKLIVY